MDDQILIIDDEDLPQTAPRPAGWKVMIVDDEPEVHRITKITLSKFEFDGKPIDFLHAYSAAEAKALLAVTPDVALLLLDVVMEADHFCMHWRGVKDSETKMVNSVMRGSFLKDAALRREFLSLINLKA